jgi:phosphoglycolate phosphatase
MSGTLPRAVVFDWDNTLVDSWEAIAEAINYVRARYGLVVWTLPEIIHNCTRSAREIFPVWFGDKWQAAWDDYYAHFDIVRARIGIQPLTGATDLLVWLKANSIPAVVVSNKSGKYLRQEADTLKWNPYFAALAGAHDASRDKPAREHVDHALQLAGLEAAADIWFVGDSEADITCARNSGCTPVLIGGKEFAERHKIDMYFADCSELLGLLSHIHSVKS